MARLNPLLQDLSHHVTLSALRFSDSTRFVLGRSIKLAFILRDIIVFLKKCKSLLDTMKTRAEPKEEDTDTETNNDILVVLQRRKSLCERNTCLDVIGRGETEQKDCSLRIEHAVCSRVLL